MSKALEQVFQCIVCGKAWSSKQALRAHMKAHRGEGYRSTSIVVNRERWDLFKELCMKHKTTTCHVMDVLMKAWIKGEELGVVEVSAPNPMVVNVTEVFLGKPRSGWKHPLNIGWIGRLPQCRYLYRVYSVKGTFACSWHTGPITGETCQGCLYLYGWTEVK